MEAIGKEKRLELIKTAERTLESHLTPELQNRLISSSEFFLQVQEVNYPTLKKRLTKLHRLTFTLFEKIESSDPVTREFLNWDEDGRYDGLFSELEMKLSVMDARIEYGLFTRPKRRGGPSVNWALRGYVSTLAEIYKEVTRKKLVRHGEFHSFVKDCLDVLGAKYHSNDSIDNMIRKVSKEMGKHYIRF